MYEDAYKHIVFMGYLVSTEEDASGRTYSSMVASPSWLPIFQEQMKDVSVRKQIWGIERMIESVSLVFCKTLADKVEGLH